MTIRTVVEKSEPRFIWLDAVDPTPDELGELAYGSVHPLFFIEGIQGSSLFYISEEYNLRGPNTYFSGTAEAGAFGSRELTVHQLSSQKAQPF